MQTILFPEDLIKGEETFDAYINREGYCTLRALAAQAQPETLIEEIARAGLRGRGGAGFPTAKKWSVARQTEVFPRYLVGNGGEDEPGSLKDRRLMEARPHLILEGALLAALAIGAEKVILYVNHMFDHAATRLQTAVDEARAAGYLGASILGGRYCIEVEICKAPSNYVAGEDTAALEVIEGRPPLPRQKPPYPAVQGLYGKPTVVNNVETLANVPVIARMGAEAYRRIGAADSPGTMLFSLGAEVRRPGVYELPFGTPLRHLIFACGGGLSNGSAIKAILPGGPSTAFLTPDHLDTALDHASLADAGSAIGCGVVSLFDVGACMVEETLALAQFFARESCGQCPACRMETAMLATLIERVQNGAPPVILDQIDKVLDFNRGKGYCALVNMPGPPLRSAVRWFGADFDHHLRHGTCPIRP
ncbi:MAG: SLBB domain-containing protein [Acidobacteria bacterium]|nr:SLBB domain-containing protein [Acidobacteriota bacterium]